MYAQDENATHTQLYTSHFDLMKMTAGKRSPPIKPLYAPAPLRRLRGAGAPWGRGSVCPWPSLPSSVHCPLFSNPLSVCYRLGMNPFQKNPKHASVLAERYFCMCDTVFIV